MTAPPRKWLMDRIKGNSKYGDRERPWFPCCWVPPPVGWCPGLLEENCCCRMFGRMGMYSSESYRFWMMHFGFMINMVSMFLILYATLAISNDYDLLSKASFSKLTLGDDVGNIDAGTVMYVGLRSVAVSKDDVQLLNIDFDDFCGLEGIDYLMDPADCDSCQSMALNYVISVMFAAILVFPSLFINISRMYSGYDVNCSKFFSGALSLCSILLSLNVLLTHKLFCGDTFFKGLVAFGKNGEINPSVADSYVDYSWEWGWGTVFLIAGVVCKTVELLLNCCIPTPSVTRDRKEQEIYEDIVDVDE